MAKNVDEQPQVQEMYKALADVVKDFGVHTATYPGRPKTFKLVVQAVDVGRYDFCDLQMDIENIAAHFGGTDFTNKWGISGEVKVSALFSDEDQCNICVSYFHGRFMGGPRQLTALKFEVFQDEALKDSDSDNDN